MAEPAEVGFASRSLASVGPNATLVSDDIETVVRRLKAELTGEIGIGGPELAQSLTEAGLIDDIDCTFGPLCLAAATALCRSPATASPGVERAHGWDVMLLTYVPACAVAER